MSFAFGFQQNHVCDLRILAARIEAGRQSFPEAVVNLDLLRAARDLEKILPPVRLRQLMELGAREIAGTVSLIEECKECQGAGEHGRYVQDDPEDNDTVRDVWEDCGRCNGAGKVLSSEVRQHFGLFDPRARIAARKACNLSYRQLYHVLHRKRLLDSPKRKFAQSSLVTDEVPF